VFAVLATVVLLAVMWAPSWVVLPRDEGLEAVWRIWIAQVMVATALAFLADKIGLLNPAGYMLGICFGVGLVGAFVLHRRHPAAWLMKVALGCATAIVSFVAMILLIILALYLKCGACEPEYNSSASDYFILVPAAPLFLVASIILGAVVGHRMKLPAKIQNGSLSKSH
jgi:hypothetical protein